MTFVALALACGWALTAAGSLRLLRSERREAARERTLLINQVLHAAGRTWQQPPAADNGHEPVSLSYTTHPEALDWEVPDA